jgi:protein-tyrosine phosphatase
MDSKLRLIGIVAIVLTCAACRKEMRVAEEDVGSPSRVIELEGQANFRDLGGYETADGRTVKWGEVYRSGRFAGLSEADLARLEALGLRSVASFLTDGELADAPSRLPPSVEHLRLPLEAGNLGALVEVTDGARKTGDFSKVPPELNPDIHRQLMTGGREYYAELLREIADPAKRPLVFHCSHGVHRTGTAAAILLSALGVPWETVREDYLLSNEARKDEVEKRLGQLKVLDAKSRGIPVDEVDTTNMEAFYVLEGGYIDAALEQAVADFGSMEVFIRDGLGITDEEVEVLRRELLEDSEGGPGEADD